MITCTQARALLSDYLDGDLTPAEVAAVDDHLATCASCPPLARATAGVLARLRRTPLGPPSRQWLTGVLAALGPAPAGPGQPLPNPNHQGDIP